MTARKPARRTPETPDQVALRWFPVVMRYTGWAIALYEMVFEQVDRPALLGLAATMMSGSLLADAVIERRRG